MRSTTLLQTKCLLGIYAISVFLSSYYIVHATITQEYQRQGDGCLSVNISPASGSITSTQEFTLTWETEESLPPWISLYGDRASGPAVWKAFFAYSLNVLNDGSATFQDRILIDLNDDAVGPLKKAVYLWDDSTSTAYYPTSADLGTGGNTNFAMKVGFTSLPSNKLLTLIVERRFMNNNLGGGTFAADVFDTIGYHTYTTPGGTGSGPTVTTPPSACLVSPLTWADGVEPAHPGSNPTPVIAASTPCAGASASDFDHSSKCSNVLTLQVDYDPTAAYTWNIQSFTDPAVNTYQLVSPLSITVTAEESVAYIPLSVEKTISPVYEATQGNVAGTTVEWGMEDLLYRELTRSEAQDYIDLKTSVPLDSYEVWESGAYTLHASASSPANILIVANIEANYLSGGYKAKLTWPAAHPDGSIAYLVYDNFQSSDRTSLGWYIKIDNFAQGFVCAKGSARNALCPLCSNVLHTWASRVDLPYSQCSLDTGSMQVDHRTSLQASSLRVDGGVEAISSGFNTSTAVVSGNLSVSVDVDSGFPTQGGIAAHKVLIPFHDGGVGQASSQDWLFVPTSGFGDACGKIGLTQKTFAEQASPCSATQGTCMTGQISEYIRGGQASIQNLTNFGDRLWGSVDPAVGFEGQGAKQRVRIAPSGDAIQLQYRHTSTRSVTVRAYVESLALKEPRVGAVSAGSWRFKSLYPAVAGFDADLSVDVKNVGEVTGDFQVTIACSDGVTGNPSAISSIAPGVTTTVILKMTAPSNTNATAACTISIAVVNALPLWSTQSKSGSINSVPITVSLDRLYLGSVTTGRIESGQTVTVTGARFTASDTLSLISSGSTDCTSPAIGTVTYSSGDATTAVYFIAAPVGSYAVCYLIQGESTATLMHVAGGAAGDSELVIAAPPSTPTPTPTATPPPPPPPPPGPSATPTPSVTGTPSVTATPSVTPTPLTTTSPTPVAVGSVLPQLEMESSNKIITEGGSQSTVKVTLSVKPVPAENVVIDVVSKSLDEGKVTGPSSLTFTPTNWDSAQTFTVQGVDDDRADGDQPVVIEVSVYIAIGSERGFVRTYAEVFTCKDNDIPGLVVTEPDGWTNEDGLTTFFTVKLASIPTGTVSVPVGSSLDTEGRVTSGSIVTFQPGTWSIPQTVNVQGVDDAIKDGIVDYFVQVGPSTASSAQDTGYNGLQTFVPLVNIDNDSGDVQIRTSAKATGSSLAATSEAGEEVYVYVAMPPDTQVNRRIRVRVSDTSEARAEPVFFLVPAGRTPEVLRVTVTGVDDQIVDGNVTFQVIVEDEDQPSLLQASIDIVNIDDDRPGLNVSTPPCVTTELPTTSLVTVALTSEPTSPVSVYPTSAGIYEGVAVAEPRIFTASDWHVPQNITVTGVRDDSSNRTVEYDILWTISSVDSVYNDLVVPPKLCYNSHIDWPTVLSVSPQTVSLEANSTSLTIVGSKLAQAVVTVDGVKTASVVEGDGTVLKVELDMLQLRHATPTTTPPQLRSLWYTSQVGLMQASEGPTIAAREEGYMVIRVTNPDGGYLVLDKTVYLGSGNCFKEGWVLTESGECLQCDLSKTVCPGGKRSWPRPGFSDVGDSDGQPIQCRPPQRCKGGQAGECADGYTGTLCAHCAPNYYQSGQLCVKCGEGDSLIAAVAGAFLVMSLLVAGFTFIVLRCRDRTLTSIIDSMRSLQMLQVVGTMAHPDLPGYVAEFFRLLSGAMLNYDFVYPGCLGVFDLQVVFIVTIAMYLLLAVLFIVVLKIAQCVTSPTRSHLPPSAATSKNNRLTRVQFYRTRLTRILEALPLILFTNITQRSFQMIWCQQTTRGLHLVHDFTVTCYTGLHILVAALAWVFLLCCVVIYPLIGYLYTRQHRGEPSPKHGFFYESVRDSFCYYNIGRLYILLVLVAASVCLTDLPKIQAYVSGLAVVTVLGLAIAARPFRDGYQNANEALAAGACLVVLGVSYMIYRDGDMLDMNGFNYVSNGLVVICVLCVLLVLVLTIRMIYVSYRNRVLAGGDDKYNVVELRHFGGDHFKNGNLRRSSSSAGSERGLLDTSAVSLPGSPQRRDGTYPDELFSSPAEPSNYDDDALITGSPSLIKLNLQQGPAVPVPPLPEGLGVVSPKAKRHLVFHDRGESVPDLPISSVLRIPQRSQSLAPAVPAMPPYAAASLIEDERANQLAESNIALDFILPTCVRERYRHESLSSRFSINIDDQGRDKLAINNNARWQDLRLAYLRRVVAKEQAIHDYGAKSGDIYGRVIDIFVLDRLDPVLDFEAYGADAIPSEAISDLRRMTKQLFSGLGDWHVVYNVFSLWTIEDTRGASSMMQQRDLIEWLASHLAIPGALQKWSDLWSLLSKVIGICRDDTDMVFHVPLLGEQRHEFEPHYFISSNHILCILLHIEPS